LFWENLENLDKLSKSIELNKNCSKVEGENEVSSDFDRNSKNSQYEQNLLDSIDWKQQKDRFYIDYKIKDTKSKELEFNNFI